MKLNKVLMCMLAISGSMSCVSLLHAEPTTSSDLLSHSTMPKPEEPSLAKYKANIDSMLMELKGTINQLKPTGTSIDEVKFLTDQKQKLLYELDDLRRETIDASLVNMRDSNLLDDLTKMKNDLDHPTMDSSSKIGLIENTAVSAAIKLYAEKDPVMTQSDSSTSDETSIRAALIKIINQSQEGAASKDTSPDEQQYVETLKSKFIDKIFSLMGDIDKANRKAIQSTDVLKTLNEMSNDFSSSKKSIGQKFELAERKIDSVQIRLFHERELAEHSSEIIGHHHVEEVDQTHNHNIGAHEHRPIDGIPHHEGFLPREHPEHPEHLLPPMMHGD